MTRFITSLRIYPTLDLGALTPAIRANWKYKKIAIFPLPLVGFYIAWHRGYGETLPQIISDFFYLLYCWGKFIVQRPLPYYDPDDPDIKQFDVHVTGPVLVRKLYRKLAQMKKSNG